MIDKFGNPIKTTKNKVKCWDCGIEIEFDDDGITTDCMPDGYILPNHQWVCDECGEKRGLK
jgi:hypothetical protein